MIHVYEGMQSFNKDHVNVVFNVSTVNYSADSDTGKLLGEFEMTTCGASIAQLLRLDTGKAYAIIRLNNDS